MQCLDDTHETLMSRNCTEVCFQLALKLNTMVVDFTKRWWLTVSLSRITTTASKWWRQVPRRKDCISLTRAQFFLWNLRLRWTGVICINQRPYFDCQYTRRTVNPFLSFHSFLIPTKLNSFQTKGSNCTNFSAWSPQLSENCFAHDHFNHQNISDSLSLLDLPTFAKFFKDVFLDALKPLNAQPPASD